MSVDFGSLALNCFLPAFNPIPLVFVVFKLVILLSCFIYIHAHMQYVSVLLFMSFVSTLVQNLFAF